MTLAPRLALWQQGDRVAPRRRPQLARQRQPAEVVDECRAEHQHDEQRIRPGVEDIADRRQRQVLEPSRAEVIQHQRGGQKVEEELVRTENHDALWGSRRTSAVGELSMRCACWAAVTSAEHRGQRALDSRIHFCEYAHWPMQSAMGRAFRQNAQTCDPPETSGLRSVK